MSNFGQQEGAAQTQAHASQPDGHSPSGDGDFGNGADEQLEADSHHSDSAYGESTTSSYLTSIASDVRKGLIENGRRYHSYGNGEYALPSDDQELERLDMQHAMMTMLMGNNLFWAPINTHPFKVLDIGTGTGIWAMDFADMFESAEVIGTDLSPTQPDWIPPNCTFEIDDAESDWTFARNSFDFIHARNLLCSIRNWPKLISQCFDHAKPGGWVEFQTKHIRITSDDGTVAADSALRIWADLCFEAASKFGTAFEETLEIKQRMEAAGFIDVHEEAVKIPIGTWPKRKELKNIGAFEAINMIEGIEGLSLRLMCKVLGMSAEEVQVLLMEVRKEVKNTKIHSYYPFHVVYGRKP